MRFPPFRREIGETMRAKVFGDGLVWIAPLSLAMTT
jgi:hypothetical protein